MVTDCIVCLGSGDGQPGDGAAAAVSGERYAASPQSQEEREEESLVYCESLRLHRMNQSYKNMH